MSDISKEDKLDDVESLLLLLFPQSSYVLKGPMGPGPSLLPSKAVLQMNC